MYAPVRMILGTMEAGPKPRQKNDRMSYSGSFVVVAVVER